MSMPAFYVCYRQASFSARPTTLACASRGSHGDTWTGTPYTISPHSSSHRPSRAAPRRSAGGRSAERTTYDYGPRAFFLNIPLITFVVLISLQCPQVALLPTDRPPGQQAAKGGYAHQRRFPDTRRRQHPAPFALRFRGQLPSHHHRGHDPLRRTARRAPGGWVGARAGETGVQVDGRGREREAGRAIGRCRGLVVISWLLSGAFVYPAPGTGLVWSASAEVV